MTWPSPSPIAPISRKLSAWICCLKCCPLRIAVTLPGQTMERPYSSSRETPYNCPSRTIRSSARLPDSVSATCPTCHPQSGRWPASLRPGGRVTTLELTPMPPGIASNMGRFYFHRLVPLMGQLVAGDRTAYTYLPDSVDYFLTADGLADVFRQAGLVDVGYRRLGLGGVALHFGDQPA